MAKISDDERTTKLRRPAPRRRQAQVDADRGRCAGAGPQRRCWRLVLRRCSQRCQAAQERAATWRRCQRCRRSTRFPRSWSPRYRGAALDLPQGEAQPGAGERCRSGAHRAVAAAHRRLLPGLPARAPRRGSRGSAGSAGCARSCCRRIASGGRHRSGARRPVRRTARSSSVRSGRCAAQRPGIWIDAAEGDGNEIGQRVGRADPPVPDADAAGAAEPQRPLPGAVRARAQPGRDRQPARLRRGRRRRRRAVRHPGASSTRRSSPTSACRCSRSSSTAWCA